MGWAGSSRVEPVTGLRKLSFKGNGVIGPYRVGVGDTVSAGTILVSLRNEEEKAAVAVAEKELEAARAARDKVLAGTHPAQIAAARHTVDMLKERLAHARREAERNDNLARTQAVADADHDRTRSARRQIEADLRGAEAELAYRLNSVRPQDRAAAEAEVQLAEARLQWRQRQLEETQLRAPCAGQVLEIFKREGDSVRLSDNGPVVLFGDLARLRVRAEIDDRFSRQICAGQKAVLFGRGLGRETFSGRVTLVKRIMGAKTVFAQAPGERKDLSVIEVFIEPESCFTAPAGLQVDIKIAVDEVSNVPPAIP